MKQDIYYKGRIYKDYEPASINYKGYYHSLQSFPYNGTDLKDGRVVVEGKDYEVLYCPANHSQPGWKATELERKGEHAVAFPLNKNVPSWEDFKKLPKEEQAKQATDAIYKMIDQETEADAMRLLDAHSKGTDAPIVIHIDTLESIIWLHNNQKCTIGKLVEILNATSLKNQSVKELTTEGKEEDVVLYTFEGVSSWMSKAISSNKERPFANIEEIRYYLKTGTRKP